VSASPLRVSGDFLSGSGRASALVVWESSNVVPQFTVLHIPPALEENNKSRRTVALQARALARLGGRVGLLDPTGTGDSAADHGNATWDRWRDDAVAAWRWLQPPGEVPRIIWGTRLGALLAAELAADRRISPSAMVLWQPVVSRAVFFKQFLRLLVGQMITGSPTRSKSSSMPTASLAATAFIEAAGYRLHPDLIGDGSERQLDDLRIEGCPIIWREVTAAEPELSPVTTRVVAAWRAKGVNVDAIALTGPSFWAAQEIEEGTALVDSTTVAVANCLSRLRGP